MARRRCHHKAFAQVGWYGETPRMLPTLNGNAPRPQPQHAGHLYWQAQASPATVLLRCAALLNVRIPLVSG
jgi:hypothetical protein